MCDHMGHCRIIEKDTGAQKMQATKIIDQIQQHAKVNACDDTFIVPVDFPIGQYLPQGDINILRLPSIPNGAVPIAKKGQLAPGTSRGSRHCIKPEDLEHCDFYGFLDANPLEGPIIVFNDMTTIEHPEHRDYVWPAGIYAIGYQRRHADEIKRSQD
ncbi:MAG: hypothetical protein ACRCVX_01695 [Shewanella sp.]